MSHNSIQSKASIATPYFSGRYPTGAIEDRNFEVGFNGEFITNMLAPRIQEDSDQWRRGGGKISLNSNTEIAQTPVKGQNCHMQFRKVSDWSVYCSTRIGQIWNLKSVENSGKIDFKVNYEMFMSGINSGQNHVKKKSIKVNTRFWLVESRN